MPAEPSTNARGGSQFLLVAEALFNRYQEPMSARQLVDRAIEHGMLESAGKTPWQTMKAKLSVDIRRRDSESLFVRTAPGRFYLRRLLAAGDEIFEAAPLTPPVSREEVLVFPSSALDSLGRFQGITEDWHRLVEPLLGPSAQHIDRLEAEQIDDHKQVLTYIMVTRGTEVACFERGAYNRVEDSLRGLSCVGFGGHVRFGDHDLTSANDYGLLRSAARELSEELYLSPADAARVQGLDGLKVIGALNDDSSALGRRHFAFVLTYEVADSAAWDTLQRGEKSINKLRWIDTTSSDLPLEKFEYWSQLCLRTFFHGAVQGKHSYLVRRRKPLQPPHLLCVVGEIGSGKTQMTQQLRSEFGYTEINSGAVLADLLSRPALTPEHEDERGDFQAEALSFISSRDGPKELAAEIWRRVKGHKQDRVLIDGIRQRATLDALRAEAADQRVGVLYVYTPPDVAFDFYRQRRGAATSIHDFLAVREAAVEAELSSLIADADGVVYNWAGLQGFRDIARALMKDLEITRKVQ
jgi:predicted NUDIX family phosphoesterase/dephospho-CoA kinase